MGRAGQIFQQERGLIGLRTGEVACWLKSEANGNKEVSETGRD